MRLSEAVDLYLGERARAGKSASTRRKDYQILTYLMDELGEKVEVSEITYFDLMRFIDRWKDAENSTIALHVSLTKGFFRFCRKLNLVQENPAENLERPRLKRPEDKDVVSVTSKDVRAMLAACETWQEKICLHIFAFQAVRRSAASRLRWRDVDFDEQIIRYHEKGGKTIWKPIPKPLLDLLTTYRSLSEGDKGILRPECLGGDVRKESHLAPTLMPPSLSADDYVIPSYEPGKVKREERDSRIVWEIVRRVAARAGVISTCHSIRAAFAVSYLEQRPGELVQLQEMMGHDDIQTTKIYLRKVDKRKLMAPLRDFDYDDIMPEPPEPSEPPEVLPTSAVEAHTGFEPVLRTNGGSKRSGRVHEAHSDAISHKKVHVHSQNGSKKKSKK